MATGLVLVIALTLIVPGISGCADDSLERVTTGQVTSTPTASGQIRPTTMPSSSSTVASSSTSAPSSTTASSSDSIPYSTTVPARINRTADLVARGQSQGGGWFTESIAELPQATHDPEGVFIIGPGPVRNRRNGVISPYLVSSYLFLQFGGLGPADLDEHADTLNGLFIRSALISFVDYQGNRVLGWDRESVRIPLDLKAMIKKANESDIPVFLELNYTDYIPGPIGSGVESLERTDNVARTVSFLESLEAAGLRLEGVTIGDEIDDESGYGVLQPTLHNGGDVLGRFFTFAKALRARFPELKIYAFDSYISAVRGETSERLDLLRQVREEELAAGISLIDGFTFRESYVYMNEREAVLSSQLILDDVESLARSAPVRRYDVTGVRQPKADKGYLSTLVEKTRGIFGRDIDIGITEYLPAGPIQIDESDTSAYEDIDFLIHYADVVGTYAELGLDVVSSWIFANTPQQAECYLSKTGEAGLSYPVHEQLARHLKGSLLEVERPTPYDSLKVKVYVAQDGETFFLMVLNKDVAAEHTVRLVLPGAYDLSLTIPARSYTSLLLEGETITVSEIGG
jgi:hypothetical protein